MEGPKLHYPPHKCNSLVASLVDNPNRLQIIDEISAPDCQVVGANFVSSACDCRPFVDNNTTILCYRAATSPTRNKAHHGYTRSLLFLDFIEAWVFMWRLSFLLEGTLNQ